MKKRQRLLTDEQWELIAPLFPRPTRRADKRGRPPAANRACLEGILWILQTGAAWRFLPDEFPSPATCWRRLQQWEQEGVWLNACRTLLGALDEEGLLKWDETFLDGSFATAKKGRGGRQNQAGQGDDRSSGREHALHWGRDGALRSRTVAAEILPPGVASPAPWRAWSDSNPGGENRFLPD